MVACKNAISQKFRQVQRNHRYGNRLSIRLVGEPGGTPPFHIEYQSVEKGALRMDQAAMQLDPANKSVQSKLI